MKFLKKIGLTLFSLMLFCGMSMTAFASSNISTTAYVEDDNSSITAEMHSRDGKKHEFNARVTYYNKKGRIINQELDRFIMTKDRKITWTEIRDDWEKVDVRIYCDGDVVDDISLKRAAFDFDNIYACCYVNEDDNIVLKLDFKDDNCHKYRTELRCYDKKRTEIYNDIDKRKIETRGESTTEWNMNLIENKDWDNATLRVYANGTVYNLGLSKKF